MAQKTIFYDQHQALGAKFVDFFGFLLPIQYSSIIEEHNWVRQSCGLFDVSHMGKFIIKGSEANDFLENLVPSKIAHLENGRIIYSVLLLDDGSPIDDVLLYRLSPEEWLLVVNAANRDPVQKYLIDEKNKYGSSNIFINDVTVSHQQIALQGPMALAVLSQIIGPDISKLNYYHFSIYKFQGHTFIISRTGYTGEDGFEIYGVTDTMISLWEKLLEDQRVKPAGLGARDSLRLEARFPLYGHELKQGRSVLQSGLNWTIGWDKPTFKAKEILLKQKEQGIKSQLKACQMVEPGIPRDGYPVVNAQGDVIGIVSSGGYSPSLKKGIFIAWIEKPEQEISGVLVHGQMKKVEIVKGTFVPNRTLHGKAGLKN